MKHFNVLSLLFLLAVIFFLVACGSTTSDNGKYVYKAEKDQIKPSLKAVHWWTILEQWLLINLIWQWQLKSKIQKLRWLSNESFLEKVRRKTLTWKADQNAKTLESAEGGKDKVKYKIDGDVFWLGVSKQILVIMKFFFLQRCKIQRQNNQSIEGIAEAILLFYSLLFINFSLPA